MRSGALVAVNWVEQMPGPWYGSTHMYALRKDLVTIQVFTMASLPCPYQTFAMSGNLDMAAMNFTVPGVQVSFAAFVSDRLHTFYATLR